MSANRNVVHARALAGPDLATYSAQELVDWFRQVANQYAHLISPELRFAAHHILADDAITPLSSQAGYPIEAAAWLIRVAARLTEKDIMVVITTRAVVKKRTSKKKSRRKEKPARSNGPLPPKSRSIIISASALLQAYDGETAVRVTRNAVITLEGAAASPLDADLAILTGEKSPGGVVLSHAWELLQVSLFAAIEAVQLLVRRAPVHQGRVDADGNYGVEWWNAMNDIMCLRKVVEATREVVAQANSLPERNLPLDQRWMARADRLLDDIFAQFGTRLDVRAFRERPGLQCGRVDAMVGMGSRTLNELVERAAELGSVLRAYSPMRAAVPSVCRVELKGAVDAGGMAYRHPSWFRHVLSAALGEDRNIVRSLRKHRDRLKELGGAMPADQAGQWLYEVGWVCGLTEFGYESKYFRESVEDSYEAPLRQRAKKKSNTKSSIAGSRLKGA